MFHIAAMGVSVACADARHDDRHRAVLRARLGDRAARARAPDRALPGLREHPARRPHAPALPRGRARRRAARSSSARRARCARCRSSCRGCTLVSTFGMTESCGCATYTDIDDPLEVRMRDRRPADRRPGAADRRPADRRAARPGRARRDPAARPDPLRRLLQGPREDRRDLPRRRLDAHRRPRLDHRRRPRALPRPDQGHHPRRRREPLAGRDRGAPDDPPGGADRRRRSASRTSAWTRCRWRSSSCAPAPRPPRRS